MLYLYAQIVAIERPIIDSDSFRSEIFKTEDSSAGNY